MATINFLKEMEQYILEKTKLKYNSVTWNKKERSYQTRGKYRRSLNNIPVSLVFHLKLKCSCFGRFMKIFNSDQNQDYLLNINKLGLEKWNYKLFDSNQIKKWQYYHNFSEDPFNMLKHAVSSDSCIDYNYIYVNLTSLILSDCQINYVDSLKKFVNLKTLVLAGNWIKIISGNKLPSQLLFLECFLNEISKLNELCENCPTKIKHLGLGRNLLTYDSCCHLLRESGNFPELTSLDLSNNNFSNLLDILWQLKGLPRLLALNLEGNSCYACEGYKEIVLKIFPRLAFLDDTEILPEDRKIDKTYDLEEGEKCGGFIFTCYRLVGIPPPPKGVGVTHTFHLEVELPLLEPIEFPKAETPEEPALEIIAEEVKKEEEVGDKNAKNKKDKKEEKNSTNDKKYKKEKSQNIRLPKPVKGSGIYGLPDEYEGEEKQKTDSKAFTSEERQWQKIIKFNNPSVIIDESNLTLLRDTLRSKVKVKIIYLQKCIPKQTAKKKRDKGKGNDVQPNQIKEYILKKSTCAEFFCDLRCVNWSDQYLDFVWADSPKVKNNAIVVAGSLKPEVYQDRKKPKKAKRNKNINSENTSTQQQESIKVPLPTILTCHVGFGLKRFGLTQETIPERGSKRKQKE